MLSALGAIDASTLRWVISHRFAPANTLLWLLSVMGRGGLLWLALAAILTVRHKLALSDLFQTALAILIATVLADRVIKPIVARERPFVQMTGLVVIGGRPNDASFPSGHAAAAFSAATVLARKRPPAVGWWLLALAIAFSRLYLGVHYPSDVLAGACIGRAAGLVALKCRVGTS